MEYKRRLYLVLHPNLALVGSQLDPPQFADHYTSGSSRYSCGKVIFSEIDPEFRHPHFSIPEMMEALVPHPEDGRPKATKFISSHLVLEHMDFDAIQTLNLVTPEGDVLTLEPDAAVCSDSMEKEIRIFAEIAPLRMLVLSDYSVTEFGNYITAPDNPKGAPSLFYTQIDMNLNDFIERIEKHPFRETPIRSIHPSRLRDAYSELKNNPDKHTKGLCLDSSIDQISYRYIGEGFTFVSQKQTKCFRMPSLDYVERSNYKFWKHM